MQATKPQSYSSTSLMLVFVIGLFTFGTRAAFIASTGGSKPIWDAGIYWINVLQARNTLCAGLQFCATDPASDADPFYSIQRAFTTRSGIMPLVFGALASLQAYPPQPQQTYLIIASFDAIISVLLVVTTVQWGLPFWVGILAALLQTIYIPAITGTGTLLQHKAAAFFLVWIVWAYTFAFTSNRRLFFWVVLATIGLFGLGFLSLTTRPLLWVVPGLVLLLASASVKPFALRAAQIVCSVCVVLTLVVITGYLSVRAEPENFAASDIRSIVFTGLTTSGTADSQATPMSFANLWPPDDWGFLNLNRSVSLFQDFAQHPVEFTSRMIYSVWANWRYPDFIWSQSILLDLDQQKLPHVLFVIIGCVGLVWLSASNTPYRPITILIMSIVLFLSLIYGMISIEPRRVGALTPFIFLGFASFFWFMVQFVRYRIVLPLWVIMTWLALLVSLLVNVSLILAVIPLTPANAYALLTSVRLLLFVVGCLALMRLWAKRIPSFSYPTAIALVGIIALFIAGGALQDNEWRGWTLQTDGAIRQKIEGLNYPDGNWPWLIIDTGTWRNAAEYTTDVSILIDGVEIKPHGQSMVIWSAGYQPIWAPYETYMQMAKSEISPHYWYAVSVPPELVQRSASQSHTVDIRSHDYPLNIAGDYLDSDPSWYIGPSFDPWPTGKSLWRWLWNADDPRIPEKQNLKGTIYSSFFKVSQDSDVWINGDLSTQPGLQSGVFRVFVVAVPFGAFNNLLPQTPSVSLEASPASQYMGCPSGDMISRFYPNFPYVCREQSEFISFYAPDGQKIGDTDINKLDADPSFGVELERIESDWGLIQVSRVLYNIYVASLYSRVDDLHYSVGFYRPIPDTYAFPAPVDTFDLPTLGRIGFGWREPEPDGVGGTFRWSVNPASSVELDLKTDTDLSLEFQIFLWTNEAVYNSLQVSLNGINLPLTFTEAGASRIYRATIPKSALVGYPSRTRLIFTVTSLYQVSGQRFGIALNWLHIRPLAGTLPE